MIRKCISSAFLVLGMVSAAEAEGLYVCNETYEELSVAYAAFESGTWVSHGWIPVINFSCAQLTTSFANTRYYIYAMGKATGKLWGANHPFCINPNADFNIPHADNTTACENRNYFAVWVPDMVTGAFPDHYAVVIGDNLSGANNISLNHPRAER